MKRHGIPTPVEHLRRLNSSQALAEQGTHRGRRQSGKTNSRLRLSVECLDSASLLEMESNLACFVSVTTLQKPSFVAYCSAIVQQKCARTAAYPSIIGIATLLKAHLSKAQTENRKREMPPMDGQAGTFGVRPLDW
jgi:hypothetical protein